MVHAVMPEEKLSVRDVVYRSIEGLQFAAEIIRVYKGCVDLKYLDDGNIEEKVPLEEIERIKSVKHIQQMAESKSTKGDTLPRPLAGLVEDDYDVRNNIKPVVMIHDSHNADEAIVLNGAENKLAAGGGLRALRYLKN
jgi:hypothetical protein